ncbi:MAG: hypothetical protein ACYTDX_08655 [Planctomycetota bacterium]
MSRSWLHSLLVLVTALAPLGCAGPDLEPLPTDPGGGESAHVPGGGADETPHTPPATDDELFRASRDGDEVLPGVVLLRPTWQPEKATVSFSLRNDSDLELQDMVLAVVFAYPSTGNALFLPRHETFEAPLRRGETRAFTVRLSTPESVPAASFRIVPGIPEVLCPRDGEGPGTSFLGGRLECVELEMALTSDLPRIRVGLLPEDADAATLGVEARLFLVRHDSVVWVGSWVVLPHPGPESGGLRRLQWTLRDGERLAGCIPYLRIRGRR